MKPSDEAMRIAKEVIDAHRIGTLRYDHGRFSRDPDAGITAAALVIDRALSPAMDGAVEFNKAAVDAIQTLLEKGKATLDSDGYLRTVAPYAQPTADAATVAHRDDVAGIVAWLRAEAQLCDCHAHEQGECACGAWDTEPGERSYKRANIEDLADAIERGDFRQPKEPRT